MAQFIWMLERRLEEGCQSYRSLWPLGNMALRLRLCSYPLSGKTVPYHCLSDCRHQLTGELSLNFLNISNVLVWWYRTLSPSGKGRNHLDPDHCSPTSLLPSGENGSGSRMFPGSPSALETRKESWGGVDAGRNAQQSLHEARTFP